MERKLKDLVKCENQYKKMCAEDGGRVKTNLSEEVQSLVEKG
jgi:hypothetical protein